MFVPEDEADVQLFGNRDMSGSHSVYSGKANSPCSDSVEPRLIFSDAQRTRALVRAMGETLWEAGGKQKAILAVLDIPCFAAEDNSKAAEQDEIAAKALDGVSLDSVKELQKDATQSDHYDPDQPLVTTPFGHASQGVEKRKDAAGQRGAFLKSWKNFVKLSQPLSLHKKDCHGDMLSGILSSTSRSCASAAPDSFLTSLAEVDERLMRLAACKESTRDDLFPVKGLRCGRSIEVADLMVSAARGKEDDDDDDDDDDDEDEDEDDDDDAKDAGGADDDIEGEEEEGEDEEEDDDGEADDNGEDDDGEEEDGEDDDGDEDAEGEEEEEDDEDGDPDEDDDDDAESEEDVEPPKKKRK